MKTKTIKLLLIILLPIFLLTNCFTCYASNNVFLNYDFWINNNINKNDIIIDNNNNNFNTLTYNYLYSDEFGIGIHINVDNIISKDEQELLNLKVYYYIKNNKNPISATINNKSQLYTLDETMIKDYGANQINSNNSVSFMSFIKVKQINENSLISLYVSANETRYLLADNIPIKSILYNVAQQTTINEIDTNSISDTNSVENKNIQNDKTNLKSEKYINNASVTSHENFTKNNENEHSDTNNKKYYNNVAQHYNNDNNNDDDKYIDYTIIQKNNYYNNQHQSNGNNAILSKSSKISIVAGTLLTLIGLSITIISVIKNIKTNNNK